MEDFKNKVQATGIITLDLLDYQPEIKSKGLDIAEYLHLGLMLKEKEFKEKLAAVDWLGYAGQSVAVFCSSDAIVPSWAYMQIANFLSGIAVELDYCLPEELDLKIWQKNLKAIDVDSFQGEKVVVRAHQSIHPSLYIIITQLLKGKASSILYGEAGLPKVITKN